MLNCIINSGNPTPLPALEALVSNFFILGLSIYYYLNILINKNGIPFLIDPSVYYGDPLVDLAMTKLFGRFSPDFYQAYHQTTSILKTNLAAEEIYQLYYLLVHLNLFGASYYPSVIHLLKKYFR